ncbi:8-oxo-dGTP diphosphatase [Spirochaetia bacterium 38H-sp]|uniref:Oxidized purine nucleoside triphosphate hydrolase n=1 Tax=Rarispira pelagica TaxID=3141764 RepID=A0ABU9UDU3_9SPIR
MIIIHHMEKKHNQIKIKNIDWKKWQFTEKAVLCFVINNDKILLIHKKRGLGKGKINAPGGRIEEGETPIKAAIRETQEEVLITPINPVKYAELNFIFTDGYSLYGEAYISKSHTGIPGETEEAKPFWQEIDKIPYDRMWEDDRLWLPHVLNGKKVKAYFIFEKDKMLDHNVEIVESF